MQSWYKMAIEIVQRVEICDGGGRGGRVELKLNGRSRTKDKLILSR